MNINSLPDNTNNINIKLFLLDPLTVIIKLAILGNKPIGTKLLISNNVVFFQEPNVFQFIMRYYYKSNKTDLQYLYNPIHIACQYFLSPNNILRNSRIKTLFACAQDGICKLIETYKHNAIIVICLNYYNTIIKNYIDGIYNESIFQRDGMTSLYTNELIETLNEQWTDEKVKIILDLIGFLYNNPSATENVKSLENIVEHIDKQIQPIISKC
jgi:hypothetical protein